jgi:ribosomal protein S18 acetylase RimI-like enzyme
MDHTPYTNPFAKDRDWKRKVNENEYYISTKIDLLDIEFISNAFDSDDMYWAKSIPKDQIMAMLASSTTLGLYRINPQVPPPKTEDSPSSPRTPSPTSEDVSSERLEMIGFARLITDHVTAAYLSDVYILPEYRAVGLGRWLIASCDEVLEDMPAKRRALLMTSPDVGKRFYSRELGFWDVGEEKDFAICMTKRYRKLGAQEQ